MSIGLFTGLYHQRGHPAGDGGEKEPETSASSKNGLFMQYSRRWFVNCLITIFSVNVESLVYFEPLQWRML